MSEVIAVVEGHTEQTFIRDVLAPWLGLQNVHMRAALIGKVGHKGGNVYEVAKRDILNFLKQRNDVIVTCLFDFYGMGNDWPGRQIAATANHHDKPLLVEDALLRDLEQVFGDTASSRFIPYVQMYEFEALLFAFPSSLAKALGDTSSEIVFQEVRDKFNTPEEINDHPSTAPSKRITKIFQEHGMRYRKPLHGSIAAEYTTIETMLLQCPHFKSWIETLVKLGSPSPRLL